MNSATPVFRNQFVSKASGAGNQITSQSVTVNGNKAVLSATVQNATGITTGQFVTKLQGSYDGISWEDVTSGSISTMTGLGYADVAVADIDYAYLRVLAEVNAGTGSVLFDAGIAFSGQ